MSNASENDDQWVKAFAGQRKDFYGDGAVAKIKSIGNPPMFHVTIGESMISPSPFPKEALAWEDARRRLASKPDAAGEAKEVWICSDCGVVTDAPGWKRDKCEARFSSETGDYTCGGTLIKAEVMPSDPWEELRAAAMSVVDYWENGSYIVGQEARLTAAARNSALSAPRKPDLAAAAKEMAQPVMRIKFIADDGEETDYVLASDYDAAVARYRALEARNG